MLNRPFVLLLAVTLVLALSSRGSSQVSPEEHLKHHPELRGKAAQGGQPGPAKGGGGGMMGGKGMGGGKMGGMMEKMGAPKPKALYPSLMALPDLPLEKRSEVQAKAHERMRAGLRLLSEGVGELVNTAPGDDFAAMQRAAAKMEQGLAEFESGLAAHRALAEGKAPRSVALRWFRREMDLAADPPPASGSGTSGMGPFHLAVMGLLVAFTVLMVWMYFLKMRRATALLRRLSEAPETLPAKVAPAAPARSSGEPRPARAPKWKGTLVLVGVFSETPTVKTFRLARDGEGEIPFDYRPGQFLTLDLEIDGVAVKRSYTIASSPTARDYVEITVKREPEGLVSRHLHDQVKEGDRLGVSAPAGRFVFTGSEHDSVLLVAGGVGITPMMSVIRYLTAHCWRGPIDLVVSCKTPEELIFAGELRYLAARHPNLTVTETLSRASEEWEGRRGRITRELLTECVADIASRWVHVCGPNAMMEATVSILESVGLPAERIKTEVFGAVRKAAPQGPPSSEPGASPGPKVAFTVSGKSEPLRAGESILDLADRIGVEIDNSCRAGSCGSCTVKLRSGTVTMDCEDGLDPGDKERGMILACQSHATSDIEVEA